MHSIALCPGLLALLLSRLVLFTSIAQAAQVAQYSVRRAQTLSPNETLPVAISNEQWLYLVEIAIGNPAQKTLVQVDTGSSELWVNANCSSAPTEFDQQILCENIPQFNLNSSNTAKGPLGSRTLGYGSGETVIGAIVDIYEDTVRIGTLEVKSQKFGVASNSRALPVGIMGLGPALDASFAVNESYHLLLDSMAAQGVIESRAYSLGLGTASDSEGSLIFGGLDRGKYTGRLQGTPVVKSRDGGARLTVNLSSLGADAGNGTTRQYPIEDTNILLDSGHTFSKLNEDVASRIFQDLGAQLDKALGFYLVDCSLRDHPGGITFGFGSGDQSGETIITVPFREFVYTAQGLCAVGLEPVKRGQQQVLGIGFMRAAYVVFDWDNEEIYVAQAADCASEIVAIGSGPNAVPSVNGSCAFPTQDKSSAGQVDVGVHQVMALWAVFLLSFAMG